MVDIRYHIATVVALFLALGIGIFIGSTVISNDAIIKEQEHLIAKLELEFDKLRYDNNFLKSSVVGLQENLKLYDELGKEVLTLLLEQRLAGKKVALLITNPEFNPEPFINELLNTGIEITYQIAIAKDFFTRVADIENSISEIIDPVISIINQENTTSLSEYVTITGDYTIVADYLLVISGGMSKKANFIKMLDYSFVKEFQNLNIPVIAIESGDVEFSSIPVYEESGVPTIQNIDSFFGRANLIKLLE